MLIGITGWITHANCKLLIIFTKREQLETGDYGSTMSSVVDGKADARQCLG